MFSRPIEGRDRGPDTGGAASPDTTSWGYTPQSAGAGTGPAHRPAYRGRGSAKAAGKTADRADDDDGAYAAGACVAGSAL